MFVDDALVDLSANAALLAAGHAYPAFYVTVPASLRSHFVGSQPRLQCSLGVTCALRPLAGTR